MGRLVPHDPGLFDAATRHLVVLAHPDDEATIGGLLQRMRPVRVVWLTNGDGLAARACADPSAYAELRRRESISGMAAIGIPEERLRFLAISEVEIHRRAALMVRGGQAGRELAPWHRCLAAVLGETREARPDAVWTLAYQGGHLGHDLAHLCAFFAARRVSAETGRHISLYETPVFEVPYCVPLRFKPWPQGGCHQISLTPDELRPKEAMLSCYPSQAESIARLKTLIRLCGAGSMLRFRRFSLEEFGAREFFGEVPEDRDHTRSTHCLPGCDYALHRFQGAPISFRRSTRVIARAFGQACG